MSWSTIPRPPLAPGAPPPNVIDPGAVRAAFSWDDARAELDGLPSGRGLNIAHEAVDRHAAGPRAERTALRFLRRTGAVEDITYAQLAERTARFANTLVDLGVQPGDAVFVLLGRVPELYVAVLGALKARCTVTPLFSAFGPEPVAQRLELGHGRVLVTDERLYARKVAAVRDRLPDLDHVLLASTKSEPTAVEGTHDLATLLDAASPTFEIPPTDPEDPALLHFTSGTTGVPKGAVHVHGAVVAHHATGTIALDLHDDDIYWCTADPGWVTGTSYGIVSPLTHGVTSIIDEGELDAERWYRTLEEQRVTVWYTAPTAIRMLMRAGDDLPGRFDLSHLRFAASVGEPLAPDAVVWSHEVLGQPFHDGWWQTETGGIMIANLACDEIRPGSMGRPLPGIEAAILARDDERDGEPLVRDGRAVVVDEPGVEGHLALRTPWPSMFRGYLGQPERYARCFVDGWYVSGDLASRDADGRYWFVGRADDVIKSSGHLIGPFEVESCLAEHEAVAEAGVIGIPDPVAGQVVKAFVVLRPGPVDDEALRRSLMAHARSRLGPAVAPRQIEVVDSLPHTRSGKVLRRLLKARELGLPEGDLSTLEGTP